MREHRNSVAGSGKPWKLDSFPFFILASAFAAFLLINYEFCPRYVLWKGLSLPAAWSNPEVNRAVDALRQIRNPFEPIDNPTNDIIQWRLLFPMIAHYMRLPDVAYLAIPHIGCIATLAWITILSFPKTNSHRFAFVASVAMGTSSWFFVSSGWLAYFDSWYVLGLLIASFHPLRRWLVVVCLFVPWIDERFVLALPLTFAVRAVYFEWPFSIKSKQLCYDLMAIIATVIPWVAFRIYLIYVAHDQSTSSATTWPVYLSQPGGYWLVLDGLWNGLRCLWFYPAICIAILLSRQKAISAVILLVASLITLALNLRYANDISRSTSTLLPWVVLGFFETLRWSMPRGRSWLCWVTALNLLLPASHVVSTQKTPIFYLPYENFRASHPPPEVSPTNYSNKGVEAWLRKDGVAALEMFSTAIQLDGRFAEGLLNRGIVNRDLGHLDQAHADIARAIAISPKLFEAHYELARLYNLQSEKSKALDVLRKILEDAPRDDKLRPAVEELMRTLTSP